MSQYYQDSIIMDDLIFHGIIYFLAMAMVAGGPGAGADKRD